MLINCYVIASETRLLLCGGNKEGRRVPPRLFMSDYMNLFELFISSGLFCS